MASSLMIALSLVAAMSVEVQEVGGDRCHYCDQSTMGRYCCGE